MFLLALRNAHSYQWVDVVKKASELLCIRLREARAYIIRSDVVEGALAKVLFDQMSAGGLEISKYKSFLYSGRVRA